MSTLRNSLLGNAGFSGTSGIILILFHQSAASFFGVADSSAFWIIGILLILFSLTVFYEAKKQRLSYIAAIILQDLLWVVGSAVLLILQPFGLTAAGYGLVASVALVVLFFALAQSSGVMRADTGSGSGYGEKEVRYSRRIPAHREEVWETIADVGGYHRVAPNIDSSEVLSGEGEGMTRRCTHDGRQWTETCTEWIEGERYTFEVDTGAPDYPYPFSSFRGTWILEPGYDAASESSTITMVFGFTYTRTVYALLLHPFLKRKFDAICEELLDHWESELA